MTPLLVGFDAHFWEEMAFVPFVLFVVPPLAIWWAVTTIRHVLNPQGFVELVEARLARVYEGLCVSEYPQAGFVLVDYPTWAGAWVLLDRRRHQVYVDRGDAPRLLWRLWWFNVRHTTFVRGGGFYLIAATFWLAVRRWQVFWA